MCEQKRPREVSERADPGHSIAKAGRKLGLHPLCAQCRQQGSPSTLCICPGCNGRSYHKGCWDQVVNHQPLEGFPSCDPPVDYNEYVWIQHLLDSRVGSQEQVELHKKDIWSTWFGVPHQQDKPYLWVYPTLQYLIDKANIEGPQTTDQYPSLVSFFGDTGGGKSSIIRALIRNAALNDTSPAPVPGNRANKHKSTSGDVHIYADPATINKEVPIFYAGKYRCILQNGLRLTCHHRLRRSSRGRDFSCDAGG